MVSRESTVIRAAADTEDHEGKGEITATLARGDPYGNLPQVRKEGVQSFYYEVLPLRCRVQEGR